MGEPTNLADVRIMYVARNSGLKFVLSSNGGLLGTVALYHRLLARLHLTTHNRAIERVQHLIDSVETYER